MKRKKNERLFFKNRIILITLIIAGAVFTSFIAYTILFFNFINTDIPKAYPISAAVIIFSVLAVSCILFYKGVLLPIVKIEKAVRRLDSVNEDHVLMFESDIDEFTDGLNKVLTRLKEASDREHSAEILRQQSEFAELQSQINPHFLYNTLESIRGQALIDDNKVIADMTEALAKYFRYSINKDNNDLVTLQNELNNVSNYIKIQKYRFEDRFDFEVVMHCEKDECSECKIPKMTLQPIVENAVFHGLETKEEKGRIVIHIELTKERLIILVFDNGQGIAEQELKELNKRLRTATGIIQKTDNDKNNGIAMTNVNNRLKLIFGQQYGITVSSTLLVGTEVEITLPRQI